MRNKGFTARKLKPQSDNNNVFALKMNFWSGIIFITSKKEVRVVDFV